MLGESLTNAYESSRRENYSRLLSVSETGVSTKIQKMQKTSFLLFKKLTIRIRMKEGFVPHAITIWLTVGSGCLECVWRKC